METRILIFAIEGLNRAGKGTQLELLQKYLELERKIPTFALRGDGRRYNEEGEIHYRIERYSKKTGNNILTSIWEKLNEKISGTDMNADREGSDKAWDIAAKQLDKEAQYFITNQLPQMLKDENSPNGIILMDRSIISKHYREIQSRTHPFSQTYQNTLTRPDHYFVLNVGQEELLKRSQDDDNPKKSEFRRKMIIENHPFFMPATNNALTYLKEGQISILNGELPIKTVHNNIKTKVDEYVSQYFR